MAARAEARARRDGLLPLADAAAVALLVALALVADGHIFRQGLDLLDEGFEYRLASRILHGQVPYRDFFTVVTPLAFYWQALLIAVFGPGLLVGRVANLGCALATPVLLYVVGRRLAGRPLALAAAALSIPWGLPWWPQPNYSWYVVLLELAAAAVALGAAEGRARWWPAGLLAAGALLTKQNVGLLTALALSLYALWRGGPAALRGYTAGLGVPVLALLLYLGSAGALGPFWYQTVVFALTRFPRAARIPYPSLRTDLGNLHLPGAAGMEALVGHLPHAVLLGGLLVLLAGALRRARWLPEGVLAWCLTLAGLSIAYPRSDFVHIDYALAPTFLGLAWLLFRLCGGRPWLLPLALLLMGSLCTASWQVRPRVAGTMPLGLPRAAGILVPPSVAVTVSQVVTAIDRAVPPDRPVLVLPWANMLTYLAARQNPSPYDLDITLNMPPGGNTHIARIMARTHCPVFLEPGVGISAPFRVYAEPVMLELYDHYRRVGQVGPFEIWQWSG